MNRHLNLQQQTPELPPGCYQLLVFACFAYLFKYLFFHLVVRVGTDRAMFLNTRTRDIETVPMFFTMFHTSPFYHRLLLEAKVYLTSKSGRIDAGLKITR